MLRSLHRVLAVGALLALTVGVAHAKPPFAQKEGKKCTYCHAPEPPKLGYRASFYKAHNLSFAGFDDAAEAKKAGVAIGPDPDPKPKSWSAPKKETKKTDKKATKKSDKKSDKKDAKKS